MNANSMPQDENDVIRYLMKEMDPSEEVLMERAMMQDDDLLIEVESMRQTLGRMDDLPEKSPSPELTDSIIAQAAERRSNHWQWPSVPTSFYKYAAVLLVGFGLGSGAWFFTGSFSHHPANSPLQQVQNLQQTASGRSIPSSASTKPWVDKDDIIYFQDQFSPHSTSYKSMIQASMEKLTPVNDPMFQPSQSQPGIHLTSAHN